MASATATKDHEEIRKWVEERGGIPTIVKGTEGLLRIDFVHGEKSGGREPSLQEVEWERWFKVFDSSGLSFLHSEQGGSRFFKLVAEKAAEESRAAKQASKEPHKPGGRRRKKNSTESR